MMPMCANIAARGLRGKDVLNARVYANKEPQYVNGVIMSSKRKERVSIFILLRS
jgi:hypothetical protein